MTITQTASSSRSNWPIYFAPFVGIIYYIALQHGFSDAIRLVVFNSDDLDQTLSGGISTPVWGSHWIYRFIAEAISILFATAIAGSIGRERAAKTAMLGGFGISALYIAKFSFLMWYQQNHALELIDPWYHSIIEGIVIVSAPLVGLGIAEGAKEISLSKSSGVAGIPRPNFFWLWIPSYFYSVVLIGPIMKYFQSAFIDEGWGWLANLPRFMLVLLYMAPLSFGLTILSGETKISSSFALRQIAGALMLIFGWILAYSIQVSIFLLLRYLSR